MTPAAQRIVSLCPSTTETLFALGVGDALVGRTRFCVHPKGDALDAIRRVGGTKDPRIDRIVALAPDLVLMNEEENRLADRDALEAAGLRVHVSFPKDVDDVVADLRQLGALVGATETAEDLAAAITEAKRACARACADLPRMSFLYLIWRDPLMAAGPDTYISRLLALAGFDNALSGPERYCTLEPEALAQADVVLLSSEPFPFGPEHLRELAHHRPDGERGFLLVDGEHLAWHGARTVTGLRYAAALRQSLA